MSKHKKLKWPTWKKINSVENVPAEDHRKGNNKLYKALKAMGWSHWDHCNILYEGYSISCRKTFPELQHGYLHFSWKWDNQGFDDFWMGDLYGFYNYQKQNKWMHPHAMFEVKDITRHSFDQLEELERSLVRALRTQMPVGPQKFDST